MTEYKYTATQLAAQRTKAKEMQEAKCGVHAEEFINFCNYVLQEE